MSSSLMCSAAVYEETYAYRNSLTIEISSTLMCSPVVYASIVLL